MLKIYSAEDDAAYWLYVQRFFTHPQWKERLYDAGKRISLHVPVENVLDKAAFREFREYAERINEQAREIIDHAED